MTVIHTYILNIFKRGHNPEYAAMCKTDLAVSGWINVKVINLCTKYITTLYGENTAVNRYLSSMCVTCIQRIQSKGIRGLPTQTTSCPWGAEVYTEEAVLTCSMASGQRLPPPIIWHLVLLDGVLCGNSMFQQRLLICVMSVVCKEKTLFSLWSPFNTLYGVSAGWGMLRDVETLEVILGWLGWNMVQICKMVKLS